MIEEGRALIIALNKWDVAEDASSLFNGVKAALVEGLAQISDVPLLTVSAKTGKGIDMILKVAFDLRDAWSRRVPTGELNRWFEQAIDANPPPAPKGQRIKLRYITQVKTRPPTFVVFGNRTDELPESYRRYLVNAIRRDLNLGPVPLRLDFRGRPNPFDNSRGLLRQILLFPAYRGRVGPQPALSGIEEQDVTDEARDIVDWAHFEKSRTELGPGFIRILSYFKEDGVKSIAQIEQAMHDAEHDRARSPRAHPEGRIAPARRRTACEDRGADRVHCALLRRVPRRFPDDLVPEVVQLQGLVQRDGRTVRQSDQPLGHAHRANAASAARLRTRASVGSKIRTRADIGG